MYCFGDDSNPFTRSFFGDQFAELVTPKRALEIPPYTSLLISALFLHLSF